MKITVITDEKGNVIGTVRPAKSKSQNDPVYTPVAGPGQKLHEIELPSALQSVKSADVLHQKLKKYITK